MAHPCAGNPALLKSRRLPLFLCLLLCVASCARAQQTEPAAQLHGGSSGTASIHGTVQNQDGAVYEGVHVTLTRPPAATPSLSANTGSDGQFAFTDLAPGPFQLIIASPGFAPQTLSGLLREGEIYQTPIINLVFANATTEVRVTATQAEVAEAQLKEEEHQRVLGFVPNFYVAYAPDAPPLTGKQKFRLAWRSSIDPVTFAFTAAVAGVEQANNSFRGYGQGAQGYAKRFGANYADGFIGTMIGSAILPSLLKQDPRYFYKGTGTVRSRIEYAIANAVICKGDNGHWQFNYSAVLGGLAAGGISNLYYPSSDRGSAGLIFEDTGIGIAGSAVQNLFQEFVVRKLTPHLPNYNKSTP